MAEENRRSDPLENWSDLKVQLIWAYQGRPKQVRGRSLLTASFASAWLIRRGSVHLSFRSGPESYRTGAWVFPCGEESWQEFSDDADILSVRFAAQWPTGEPLFPRAGSLSLPAARAAKLARIGERLARFVSRTFAGATVNLRRADGSTPGQYFELQRLVYGWMQEYAAVLQGMGLEPNTISRLDERVRHAVHILETQPLASPLRIPVLAKATGFSVTQLNRLFVRNLGKTPAEFWEAKRLHAAQLAILESTRSMKSIAYDLGFASLAHFSFWVAKRLGASPRALRCGVPKGGKKGLRQGPAARAPQQKGKPGKE